MHWIVLGEDWALNIIRSLFEQFTEKDVKVGSTLATLFTTVPYVYLTRHIITVKITECLRRLSALSDNASDRGFPLNFVNFKESWNADSFRTAFAGDLNRNEMSKKLLTHFLQLDAEYAFIVHGLRLLVSPDMLPWATDFEGLLVEKFNEHAHSTVLADLKTTLEVGGTLKDNTSLRGFSLGCLELLRFIESANRLLVGINGERGREDVVDGNDQGTNTNQECGASVSTSPHTELVDNIITQADYKTTIFEMETSGTSIDETHLYAIFGESDRQLRKRWKYLKKKLNDKRTPDYLKLDLELCYALIVPSDRGSSRSEVTSITSVVIRDSIRSQGFVTHLIVFERFESAEAELHG